MKITKAILTGGGKGTRLHPITFTTNKHLIPLANKPMLFHAIDKVVAAGIKEVFININPWETELQKYVGDGGHWGIKVTFFEQHGGPQGVAHIVKQAEEFIKDEPFLFYLSDNVLVGDLNEMIQQFSTGNFDCMLALSKVEDPRRFGVPVFDGNIIVDVLEKPAIPPSDFAVAGVYVYGPNVFFEAFEKIEKSARGEYEISSVNSFIIKNYRVGYREITGWWKDTGEPKDLLTANRFVLDKKPKEEFKNNFGANNVHLGGGTVVGSNVRLHGPIMIGENCLLENCEIGPYVTVGSGSVIKFAKILNSIILDNATITCPIKIKDSIIGKSVSLVKKENEDGGAMIIGDRTKIEI